MVNRLLIISASMLLSLMVLAGNTPVPAPQAPIIPTPLLTEWQTHGLQAMPNILPVVVHSTALYPEKVGNFGSHEFMNYFSASLTTDSQFAYISWGDKPNDEELMLFRNNEKTISHVQIKWPLMIDGYKDQHFVSFSKPNSTTYEPRKFTKVVIEQDKLVLHEIGPGEKSELPNEAISLSYDEKKNAEFVQDEITGKQIGPTIEKNKNAFSMDAFRLKDGIGISRSKLYVKWEIDHEEEDINAVKIVPGETVLNVFWQLQTKDNTAWKPSISHKIDIADITAQLPEIFKDSDLNERWKIEAKFIDDDGDIVFPINITSKKDNETLNCKAILMMTMDGKVKWLTWEVNYHFNPTGRSNIDTQKVMERTLNQIWFPKSSKGDIAKEQLPSLWENELFYSRDRTNRSLLFTQGGRIGYCTVPSLQLAR